MIGIRSPRRRAAGSPMAWSWLFRPAATQSASVGTQLAIWDCNGGVNQNCTLP